MNRIVLVFLLASIMMGCSTVYRAGQTTDDVYFSPARPGSEYVNLEENDGYRASEVPMTDRYLRMKAFGSSRWNSFDDDYAYWNNPHWNNRSYFDVYPSYGYNGLNSLYFGRPMSYGISSYLNPFSPVYYGQPVIVYNTSKTPPVNASAPRTYNLSNYVPRSSGTDSKMGASSLRNGAQNYSGSNSAPRGGYNPRSSGESYSSPSRTFSNSSNSSNTSSSSSSSGSSSSSSSSGSSGSAPVRTFPRGGN